MPPTKSAASPGREGGPHGLEFRFLGAEVAALAGVVAVNDQSHEAFDAWSGALEVFAMDGVGGTSMKIPIGSATPPR